MIIRSNSFYDHHYPSMSPEEFKACLVTVPIMLVVLVAFYALCRPWKVNRSPLWLLHVPTLLITTVLMHAWLTAIFSQQ